MYIQNIFLFIDNPFFFRRSQQPGKTQKSITSLLKLVTPVLEENMINIEDGNQDKSRIFTNFKLYLLSIH